MAQLQAYAERTQAIQEQLRAANPTLPTLTAVIMANDTYAMEHAEGLLYAGEITYDEALTLCGSYTRVQAALRWQLEGHATRAHLLDQWTELWVNGDPDDTDPQLLQVWLELRADRGQVVTDRADLPPGDPVMVYRGQRPVDPLGIAWTLDRRVAEKFANGAAIRVHRRPNPAIILAKVDRKSVYGYLTLRNEQEVVVNPFNLRESADG